MEAMEPQQRAERGRTAEPRAGESLEAAQLESLLDEVQVGIWSMSLDTLRTIYVNPALLQILGRTREELIAASTIIPWLHPDDRAAAIAAREARLRGEAGEVELRVLRPDGETRVCRFRAHTVTDRGVARVDTMAFDVTEQRRAEDALDSGKRRFGQIAELNWNVVLMLDREHNIVHAFGSHEALTGHTPEEYASLPAEQRFHPDDWPIAERAFQAALASPGARIPVEVRRPKKGGGWVWTESLVVNLLDDPDVGAVVINTRDITARKQASEVLAAANADLERRVAEATASLHDANAALLHAARDKDAFLANMSHELRTPLNAVLGFAEALGEEVYGPVVERQRHALTRITTSATHLLSLINDILDLSKVEAGQVELDASSVSITDVCRASLSLVEGAARRKGISVSLRIADGLRAMDADPRRLKQILVNLLSNAVKFTPEGGSAGIEVSTDRGVGEARFVVWDTGIGIDPAHLPRLFKPFVQIDSSLSRKHAGTGLGLALVRRLVDLHGGSVEVESAPGAGSRFTVRLPLRRHAEPEPEARASTNPVAAGAEVAEQARAELGAATPQTRRVLLAEDDDANVGIVADFLRARGFEVSVAKDGREALDLADALLPDAVLMDIQMPVVDGLTAIRELRRRPALRATPVIAVTALVMAGDRERCLAAGADEYLAKPVGLRKLAAVLDEILSTRAAVTRG